MSRYPFVSAAKAIAACLVSYILFALEYLLECFPL
jgi:hypothetical protein